MVMPVYNEELGIVDVVTTWTDMLDRLGVDYEMLLYNDGSKDGTGAKLDALAAKHRRVQAAHHTNRGHGPTLLRGYREARGEWIFQTDSDDEIPASAFPAVWQARQGRDVVFGIRTGRPSGLGRRLLTRGAAATVRLLFGAGPRDVNVPFRLMRRSILATLVPRIPDDTFAPNVILTGLIARDRIPFTEVPVPAVARRLGRTSILGFKTVTLGVLAARQTIAVAFRDRSRSRVRSS